MLLMIMSALLVSFGKQLDEHQLPLVRTKLGAIRGTWQISADGHRYAAFMKVPYAKPPVGNLRFEPPEKVQPWVGTLDARNPSPSCLFLHPLAKPDNIKIVGQEDCLYLNIFTSKLQRDNSRIPVIVYIHGGAFMYGGSKDYGAKYLMDRDVVFVTINYRLGPFGFLSLEDDVQPGNNGMRDQVAALQWVQDNIDRFGGDPKRVTLIGLSAGGASVHYHYLSPLTRGLFQQGISVSGTAFCRWALADGARIKALRLASSLECPVDRGSQELVDCLKTRTGIRILENVLHQFILWTDMPFSSFAPVVERPNQKIPPFLPDEPASLIARGAHLKAPWITGVTTEEGLFPTSFLLASETRLARFDKEFETLVPHLLHFNFTVVPERQRDVVQSIRTEYFGDKPINEDTVQQLIKMASDRLFVLDAQRAAELQSLHSPVYFYQFGFRGKHSLSDLFTNSTKNYGVSHLDDLTYYIPVRFIKDEARTGMAKRIETLMLDLWTHFAANGVPEAKDSPKWDPVTPGGDLAFLRIAAVPPEMSHAADLGNGAFWESLPFLESAQSLGVNTSNINPSDH